MAPGSRLLLLAMAPGSRLLLLAAVLCGLVDVRGGLALRSAQYPQPVKDVGVVMLRNMRNKRRMDIGWRMKQLEWHKLAHEIGHDLDRARKCDIGDWLGFISPILVPRLKLAFCYIPKAGCTMFKDLFNALNGLNLPTGYGVSYTGSMPGRLGLNMSEVTRENGWRFSTFTRDPLDRYLSSYGSTCVKPKDAAFEHRHECCGKLDYNTGSVDDMVQRFGERAQFDADNGLPWEDQHWSSQTQLLYNCGWDRFRPDLLDFRGDLSAGGVGGQVRDMLRRMNATSKDLEMVSRFFPETGVHGHTSPITGNKASFYAKKETVEAVKRIYAADFATIPGIGDHFTARL